MPFNGCREKAAQDRIVIARLAQGHKPRVIAAELGCSYATLRRRLSRYVRATGCRTVGQAIARYATELVKAEMPLALKKVVDVTARRAGIVQ